MSKSCVSMIDPGGILSQPLENGSIFVCATFGFTNAVSKEEYRKFFLCVLVVSDWMAIKKVESTMIKNK